MKKLFLILLSSLVIFWISFAQTDDSVTNEWADSVEASEYSVDSTDETKDIPVEQTENNENGNILSDIKYELTEKIEGTENNNLLSDIKNDLTDKIEGTENNNIISEIKDELSDKIENIENNNILSDIKDELSEKIENAENDIKNKIDNKYSEEFNDAYNFAYDNDITTMDSIDNANMEWWLTRIAMAKMLSNYAMNILWKQPANIIVPNFQDVPEKLNEEYGKAVDLAYQLWIMWIWIDKFRPNDPVTRAEFATALSRMLYWLEDWLDKYYTTHLQKLKDEGIISNTDPNLKELRWYVMIMLMRSAKQKLWTLREKIENKIAEDLLSNN